MTVAMLFADLTTVVVAWWGAVLATTVFLWDVYKWRTRGPRIRMVVKPDMQAMGDPELEGKTLILISATNVGDRATTLELLAFVWYGNWWKRIRRKPEKQFLVKNPGRDRRFPYKLEVGERWDGMAFQPEETREMASTGHLVCELHHASSKSPVTKRLLMSSSAAKPATACK
jgi:hypothetical protein